jgi:hypothetical protein
MIVPDRFPDKVTKVENAAPVRAAVSRPASVFTAAARDVFDGFGL